MNVIEKVKLIRLPNLKAAYAYAKKAKVPLRKDIKGYYVVLN